MTARSELEEVLKRIRNGRSWLDFAFGDFANGRTKSVSGVENWRGIRDGLALLSDLEKALTLVKRFRETTEQIHTISEKFLDGSTQSISGNENRRRISEALAGLALIEEELSTFLSVAPPFSTQG